MRPLQLLLLIVVLAPGLARSEPIRIGAEAVVRENPRSRYSRYVNWRPADQETVNLNPPRVSWPYRPDWPNNFSSEFHTFRLQISSRPDCSSPVVDVACEMNFYNCLPELKGASKWYWRVGYDAGTDKEEWSAVRSFTLGERTTVWDRANLAEPDFARIGHPRVLFNRANLDRIRLLHETDPASHAALEWICRQADRVLERSWWNDFPESDREDEPRSPFYAIAHDLALVAFVYRMTEDEKYAGVKERAVVWAGYPPGGRSSPEGLGGDGSEDATQGNEFLALLFDWLYQDLDDRQRQVMIDSLGWRVDHIMNSFAWRRLKPDRSGRPRLAAAATVPVSATSLGGSCSSHQYEGSMDTAVCGLVLYEHSQVGRQWYELMVNYLIGVTCGHGFDECWNEGPGYGTSKCKWLVERLTSISTRPSRGRQFRSQSRLLANWRVLPPRDSRRNGPQRLGKPEERLARQPPRHVSQARLSDGRWTVPVQLSSSTAAASFPTSGLGSSMCCRPTMTRPEPSPEKGPALPCSTLTAGRWPPPGRPATAEPTKRVSASSSNVAPEEVSATPSTPMPPSNCTPTAKCSTTAAAARAMGTPSLITP